MRTRTAPLLLALLGLSACGDVHLPGDFRTCQSLPQEAPCTTALGQPGRCWSGSRLLPAQLPRHPAVCLTPSARQDHERAQRALIRAQAGYTDPAPFEEELEQRPERVIPRVWWFWGVIGLCAVVPLVAWYVMSRRSRAAKMP